MPKEDSLYNWNTKGNDMSTKFASDNISALHPLEDTDTRRVFETIASNKQAVFKDVVTTLGLEEPKAVRAIKELVHANLIKGASLPEHTPTDFQIFYITADGLSVASGLKGQGKSRKLSSFLNS